MLKVKEIKSRISIDEEDHISFYCNEIKCSQCPFYVEPNCGGMFYLFDFKAIKDSKVRTLKGLLKFKTSKNNYKYQRLGE